MRARSLGPPVKARAFGMTPLTYTGGPSDPRPSCRITSGIAPPNVKYLNMRKRLLSLSILLLALSAFAAAPEPIDAGKTTDNVFQSSFFHFRYELPRGWYALDDKVRLDDNAKRYKDELNEAIGKNDQTAPENQHLITEAVIYYNLLLAAKVPVPAADATPKPRIVIMASKQRIGWVEAGDPAKMYIQMGHPKVLKEPGEVVISGHKFVRADLELHANSFLSKFATVDGNYIIEFDIRTDNEKDLAELVKTMQSVQFTDK